MEKKLFCVKDLFFFGESIVTSGKEYIVTKEDKNEYHILDDMGDTHIFTKYLDEDGVSYLTWFMRDSDDKSDDERDSDGKSNDDVLRFVVYENDVFEEERALVDLANKEVVLHGDYYHDKIDHLIDGFLKALDYIGKKYKVEKEIIYKSHEMFGKIGFQD